MTPLVYRVDPSDRDERILREGYPPDTETVLHLADTKNIVEGWYGDEGSVFSIDTKGLRTLRETQNYELFDGRFVDVIVIRILDSISPQRVSKIGEYVYDHRRDSFTYVGA